MITSTVAVLVNVLTKIGKFSEKKIGHQIRIFSVFTPINSASEGSIAVSMSRYAQYPAERRQKRHYAEKISG
jgi:hypothetical protein